LDFLVYLLPLCEFGFFLGAFSLLGVLESL